MLKELERIAGKVANAPRPPLPEGMVESVPKKDSPEMLLGDEDPVYLPAGVVIEYTDDQDQVSLRRVTLLSASLGGEDPSFTAYCHARRDLRRFRFARPMKIIDPVTETPYASPAEFLQRFRCHDVTTGDDAALRQILCSVRDELTMLMFFSRCDGFLHPAERTVVLSFIRDASGENCVPDDDIWDIVQRLYPDSRAMLNCARDIVATKGPEAMSSLQNTIRVLIEADGVIHSDEALHTLELLFLDSD